MTLNVRLYTKPGCHLCEQAETDLTRLRKGQPHRLELVDITTSDELMRDYGERVPVLLVGGREYDAPLPMAVLERALRNARMEAPR